MLILVTADSEIIRVPLFGSNIIILNSLRVATDLLEKKSTIYSDRYCIPCVGSGCFAANRF